MSKLNNKGISLLEAAITIAVIMLGILVLSKVFPVAFQAGKSSEQATIATNLAQSKLEEMFYLDYDNISTGTIEAKQRLAADSSNPFYHYQRETIIDHVDINMNTSQTATGLKRITVNTYYNSPLTSAERTIQLILLISEK
jgi:Tfp pilus assembly protein PilV